MTQDLLFVGIDVSSTQLDIAVHPTEQTHSVPNTAAGHTALLAWLKTLPPLGAVACEATGGYEREVIEVLLEAGHHARILNAGRVRKFAEALGRAKNDRLDAQVIAHFAAVMPGARAVIDPVRRELRMLAQWHAMLTEQLTQTRNLARLDKTVIGRSLAASHIKSLRKQIATVARAARALIAKHDDLARQRDVLTSMPGVGPQISVGLLAWLPELGEATPGQVASLVGVAPFDDDSGTRHGKRRTRGGRTGIRNLLYMGALVASRRNPVLRDAYKALVARGKPRKVALIAIARRMLTILNAMMARGEPWKDVTAPSPAAPA